MNPSSLLLLLVAVVVTAVDGACDLVCHNNGACMQGGSDPLKQHCVCAAGYVGTFCEYKAVNCSLDCQNGGVCLQGGLVESHDEASNNSSTLWSDNATYASTSSNYNKSPILEGFAPRDYCECGEGFYGALCEYKAGNCSLDCQNGGACMKGSHTVLQSDALYNSSFTDDDCTSNNKSSASTTLVFAEIQVRDYCVCTFEYFGALCEYTTTNCSLDCQNGGVCVQSHFESYDDAFYNSSEFLDDDDSYNTSSVYNTSSSVYNSNHNYNASSPNNTSSSAYSTSTFRAGHGPVIDYCECEVGFFGALCEYDYTTLNCSIDCQNGGICVQGSRFESYDDAFFNSSWLLDDDAANNTNASSPYNTSSFPGSPWRDYCECPYGYVGFFCEEKAANCSADCQNGGVCVHVAITQGKDDLPADFGNATVEGSYDYCECPFGFVGPRCEIPKVVCGHGEYYCYNGGVCFEGGCLCPVNYTGVSCETVESTTNVSVGIGAPTTTNVSVGVGAPTNQSSITSFENSTTVTEDKRGDPIVAVTHNAIDNSSDIPSEAPVTNPTHVVSIKSEAATADKTSGAFRGSAPLMRIVALLAVSTAAF